LPKNKVDFSPYRAHFTVEKMHLREKAARCKYSDWIFLKSAIFVPKTSLKPKKGRYLWYKSQIVKPLSWLDHGLKYDINEKAVTSNLVYSDGRGKIMPLTCCVGN